MATGSFSPLRTARTGAMSGLRSPMGRGSDSPNGEIRPQMLQWSEQKPSYGGPLELRRNSVHSLNHGS